MTLALLALAMAGDLDGSGVAPRRALLAEAVRDYHDGREDDAAALLEGLLEARPGEDDAAYWLGRIRLEGGDCAAAAALVSGRSGRGQPTWRFRAVEGMALASCGRPEDGLALLQASVSQAGMDPERPGLEAALGLLLVDAGDEAAGAAALVAAGGDPIRVLAAPLAAALPGAGSLLAVQVLAPAGGAITARQGGLDWRLDLETGLLRRAEIQAPTPRAWAHGDEGAPVPRSQARRCGSDWIWTSPAEPLSAGEAGVFRAGRSGRVERLERTPALAADDSPFCAGDTVGWVRRIGGTSQLILLDAAGRRPLALGLPVAVADARIASGGLELVLGVIDGGEPAVWWKPADGDPRPLIASAALTAPRWAE